MLLDQKKISQVILSESPKRIRENEVPNGMEVDFSKAQESLAAEMIEGLKNSDPRMVSLALKQFISLCDKEEEYTETEGE